MNDQRKSTTVLVVDDHPAIRSTMTDVLEAEGFIPDHAENGSDAIRKCIENDYDFVLLDMQMPDMNGVEVLRQLKAKNRYHSKFIVITAFSVRRTHRNPASSVHDPDEPQDATCQKGRCGTPLF